MIIARARTHAVAIVWAVLFTMALPALAAAQGRGTGPAAPPAKAAVTQAQAPNGVNVQIDGVGSVSAPLQIVVLMTLLRPLKKAMPGV